MLYKTDIQKLRLSNFLTYVLEEGTTTPFFFVFVCDIIFSPQKCDYIKAITQLCSLITSLWYKS